MAESTLKAALYSRGYTSQLLELDGRTYIEFIAPNGWTWMTRKNFYDFPFVSVTAFLISKNKARGNSYAQHHNVPVAPYIHSDDFAAAKQFMDEHTEVIVKPVSSSGSRGLTLNITSDLALQEAMIKAKMNGLDPLIQKQFGGEEVRITIIDGKVCSAILRQTPRVTGDATSTIAELIRAENNVRRSLKFPKLSYPEIDDSIITMRDVDLESVPAKGTIIEFSHATMIRNGSSFYGVMDELHQSYKTAAEKLAQTLSPKMLVVDFLIRDYTKMATQENYIFLEFNTTPALEIYSSLRGGDKPDIISLLADAIDLEARNSLN